MPADPSVKAWRVSAQPHINPLYVEMSVRQTDPDALIGCITQAAGYGDDEPSSSTILVCAQSAPKLTLLEVGRIAVGTPAQDPLLISADALCASRRHVSMRFSPADGQVEVRDLNTPNGTFVQENGGKWLQLSSNQWTILPGGLTPDVTLRFALGNPVTPTPTPVPPPVPPPIPAPAFPSGKTATGTGTGASGNTKDGVGTAEGRSKSQRRKHNARQREQSKAAVASPLPQNGGGSMETEKVVNELFKSGIITKEEARCRLGIVERPMSNYERKRYNDRRQREQQHHRQQHIARHQQNRKERGNRNQSRQQHGGGRSHCGSAHRGGVGFGNRGGRGGRGRGGGGGRGGGSHAKVNGTKRKNSDRY